MSKETHIPPQRPLLDEVKASLLYLKSLGLQGVECTDEAAKLLGTFGQRTPLPPRKPIAPRAATPRPSGSAPSGDRSKPEPAQTPGESLRQPLASSAGQLSAALPVVDTLESIRSDLGECTRCGLFRGRSQIVFGSGNPSARLMFIGDVPLAEEGREGFPFLGESGELLNRMLQAMGLTRDDVYLSNILKCCPNDFQGAPEMGVCLSFLERQIATVRPEVICTLGAVAAQTLLRMTSGIAGIRGQFQNYRGIRLMPTFHPTFLLRHPERKAQAWQDLQQVMAVLGLGKR